jgi:chromosome segregation ATPase
VAVLGLLAQSGFKEAEKAINEYKSKLKRARTWHENAEAEVRRLEKLQTEAETKIKLIREIRKGK